MSSPASDVVEKLLTELGQRSSVRIDTNAKGQAQTKVSVYAGETEAEMERLSLIAFKIYEQLQEQLGTRAASS